jgi:tetratricopeptide (TPR) repeat protein
MKRAAAIAWEKKWSRAIEEYERALAEFPQDVAALTGLGLAYAETRQLNKALDRYKQAANLSPDNPEVIQRVGQTFERLAQWPDAARAYVLAADAHLRLRDVSQATEMWRKAVILDPQNLQAHHNLAQVYKNQGDSRKAARHYLIMARVLDRQAKADEALEHCTAALELDPRNREAQGILDALQHGLPLPDGPTARLQPDAEGKRTLDSFVVFEDIELDSASLLDDESRRSPADMLREHSLTRMAEALFSDDSDPQKMEANLLLAQAADFETRGFVDRAVEAYESAREMGVNTPAVLFNLGLLYMEKREFSLALEYLNRTASNPDYKLGAHFAIGECYQAQNEPGRALQHFMQVLKAFDAQTIVEGQTAELDATYAQLHQQYIDRARSKETLRCIRSISSFLSTRGWGHRLIQARRQLDSLTGGSPFITLAETLTEPEAGAVVTALGRTQGYIKQDMLFTALEESLWAIQQAPYYLPLHLGVAEILLKEERLDEAAEKYIAVAETYRTRGDLRRAIGIFRKALEIVPMDVQVRERLIRILTDSNMMDQAIEQYIALANTYYQLAQVDLAIEKYDEALRYTAISGSSRHWEGNILHRLGDIHMQRVDWRQAIKVYQRIKRANADDEKARAYLIDLYFKTGQQDQAIRELDELTGFFKAKRQPRKALSILESIVRSRSQDPTLHLRLARAYLDARRKKEAIAELDAVGELQLEAGKTQDAIHTIQAIIRLGPENIEGYQQLLAQLRTR